MNFWKSWLARLGGRQPLKHSPRLELELRKWQALPEPDLGRPVNEQRCVVVDVETTGLNTKQDCLVAIGAVAVSGGAIHIDDSFECILRQETPSDTENILIHGIATTEQRGGADPAEALIRFLHYAGKDPLLAFHAVFDMAFIERAVHAQLGIEMRGCWLDLAELAPVVAPASRAHSLDGWLEYYGIVMTERHRAMADAVATAQLFLMLIPNANRHGGRSVRDLMHLARDHRWFTGKARSR